MRARATGDGLPVGSVKGRATMTTSRPATKLEDHLEFIEAFLLKADARRRPADAPGGEQRELQYANELEVLAIENTVVTVRSKQRIYFTPDGPFQIDIEAVGRFSIVDGIKVTKEQLEKILPDIAFPLLSFGSMTTGLLTTLMNFGAILLPPSYVADE